MNNRKLLKLAKEILDFVEEEDAANKLLDRLKGIEQRYYKLEYYNTFHENILSHYCKQFGFTLIEQDMMFKTAFILIGNGISITRYIYGVNKNSLNSLHERDDIYKDILREFLSVAFNKLVSLNPHPAMRLTSTHADDMFNIHDYGIKRY